MEKGKRGGGAEEPVIIYVYAINLNQGRPRRQQCSCNVCQSQVRYAGKQLTQCCSCHCPWSAWLCFSSCCPCAIFVQCEGQTSAAAAHSESNNNYHSLSLVLCISLSFFPSSFFLYVSLSLFLFLCVCVLQHRQ